MEKQQIISLIKESIDSGAISSQEIIQALKDPSEHTTGRIVSVLYGIGALIVIIGVAILLANNWKEIGFAARLGATFGVALVTYVAGCMVKGSDRHLLSSVLFTIAAALTPISAVVFFQEMDINITYTVQIITSLVAACIFGVALWAKRYSILTIYTAIPLSWMYYAFILNFVVGNNNTAPILKWATIVLGIAYLLFAYAYRNLSVAMFFEFFGTLGILTAWISFANLTADMLFIPLLFAGFYMSTVFKSRGMLALSSVFLIIHMIRLTFTYFSDSISWSLTLIIAGFLIIGIGYGTLRFGKKYISA